MTRLARFARYARRLAALGPTPAARVKIVLAAVELVLRAVLGRSGRATAVRIACEGRSFRVVVADFSELEVLREIFLEGEYELPSLSNPVVIVDLGSNVGLSVLYFHARYPQAQIVAVEPDPDSFGRLRANTAPVPGIRTLNVAVGGFDGRRKFFPSRQAWTSSLFPSDGRAPIEIECRSLDSILQELGIIEVGLLKIDVEGAEEETLRSFGGLGHVGAVAGEIHLDRVQSDPAEVLGLLGGFELAVDRSLPDRWKFKGLRKAA